ncbi:MAG TPA: MerR family transcriptional regulator [Longimicrobiales bacterium]|nr:MerR family transcriptional regulator [Longimicrobiales bacterium]
MEPGHWKVSEVAERARVTVRTLHHYDEINLLVPSRRTDSGYRLYTESDLERLYRILLYRELGFSLEGIARVLDDPAHDPMAALRAQRALLMEKRRRTDAVIDAVDRTLETMERGEPMSREEIMSGFDAFANAPAEVRSQQAEHATEVRERWGETDAYRESMRRARGFTKADWAAIQQEASDAEKHMAELLAAGADPEGAEAMAGAESLREHISRWFYSCSHRMHAGLADMYESDPRFTAYYDQRAEGLAAFVATAIRANAIRAWDEGSGGS